MSDIYQLNLTKQMHNMMASPPKPRGQIQSRNPLIPNTLEPENVSKSRSLVPDYMDSSKKQADRPRGIAKSSFTDKHAGSFAFSYEAPEEFVPSRKIIGQKSSETFEPTVSLKKAAYQPPERNPITQDSEALQASQPKIRGRGQPATSLGQILTQDSTPIEENSQRASLYGSKNKSNIFEKSGGYEEPEKPRKKATMNRPDSAGSLLQYNYALQFRDSGVANKPSENRVEKEALQQTKVTRGMAEVFKMKRNMSAVTFA